MSVVIITCKSCGNRVQIPRADVEAAGEVECRCGSKNLEIRDPSGKLLIHRSQQAAMQAGRAQATAGPQFSGAGMTYTVTCRRCGNQVEVDGAEFQAAGRVQCNCGSTDLDVQQPPPSTAEMMAAVRQLSSSCPLCGNTGWVEVEGGRLFPCKACQGV